LSADVYNFLHSSTVHIYNVKIFKICTVLQRFKKMCDESMQSYSHKKPTPSYGIILFYILDGVYRFLIAQRRDTIEYIDYLRGRYTDSQLELYFSLMTQSEKDRLANWSFEELWDDLWIDKNNNFWKNIYPKAMSKYNHKKNVMLQLLQENEKSTIEPSWGFPKGKKEINETDIECAMREFSEETGMTINYTNLLTEPPFKETYRGTNGRIYTTVYYLAYCDSEIPIVKIPLNGIRKETVSDEIGELKWVTLEESRQFLNRDRQSLLELCIDKKLKSKHGVSI